LNAPKEGPFGVVIEGKSRRLVYLWGGNSDPSQILEQLFKQRAEQGPPSSP
jgi:hypothetical protein